MRCRKCKEPYAFCRCGGRGETANVSGSPGFTGCKAERDFEMMLKRIVSAIKDKQSITYNELAIKAEDLLRRKGSKNTFLR